MIGTLKRNPQSNSIPWEIEFIRGSYNHTNIKRRLPLSPHPLALPYGVSIEDILEENKLVVFSIAHKLEKCIIDVAETLLIRKLCSTKNLESKEKGQMKDIIEKIKEGNHIDDKELKKAIDHYQQLIDLLNEHGELYQLVRVDALLQLQRLQSWQEARERNKTSN